MMIPIDQGISELKHHSLIRHHIAHGHVIRVVAGTDDVNSRIEISDTRHMNDQIKRLLKDPKKTFSLDTHLSYTFAQIRDASLAIERTRAKLPPLFYPSSLIARSSLRVKILTSAVCA